MTAASEAEAVKRLEALAAAYKADYASLKEYERAQREAAIWDAAPVSSRDQFGTVHGCARWLLQYLGGTCGSSLVVQARNRLWNAAGDATALWAEVDAYDMPLGTAAALLRKARSRAGTKQLPLHEAVEKELVEYRKLPATKRSDGKVVRRSNVMRNARMQAERSTGKGVRVSRRITSERGFWTNLRGLIAEFVAMRTVNVKLDEQQREQFWQDLEHDLRLVVEHWSHKIQRLRQGAQQPVTRRQLAQACLMLAIDPPDWGTAIDLHAASRRKRELARAYHPDRRGGDESMRDRLQAVLDAFDLCERYAKEFGSTALAGARKVIQPSGKPALRVVSGGAAAHARKPDEDEVD